MADDRLIAAYLRELRFSVTKLADADEIVEEAEDHLLEAVEHLVADGRTPAEAEAEAVARFGSAALVAKLCISESTKGAAVPTRRTRIAGYALLATPLLFLLGLWGNEHFDTHDSRIGHGIGVLLLVIAFPALVVGLWGLRTRHGGLGRLGRAAFILAALSPFLSLLALWGAAVLFLILLAVSVLAFGIEMLRASVLPVRPLTLVVGGPVVLLLIGLAAIAVTLAGGDAGRFPVAVIVVPVAVTTVGLAWLGWHLSQETPVDRGRPRPLATA